MIKILAATFVLAVAVFAQGQQPNGCQICEHLIGQARHYFNNNVTNEAALQKELIQECKHLQPASVDQQCEQIVNQNIDKIFSDIQSGDKDGQTCYDIGECSSVPTYPTHPNHQPTRASRV